MVFQELAPSQAHKIKNRTTLESELFGTSGKSAASNQIRDNEGEAAEYGVYFDDTEYDYMQHMRDLNSGSADGESYFLEAPKKKGDGKGKAKISLADALRNASLEDHAAPSQVQGSGLLDESILPSNNLSERSYQDQQDVPDMLAGFQPDMDPRLREVLEALEDEAYVDDEDFFGELAKDVSISEFEDLGSDEDAGGVEDDDGWESDATVKPANEHKSPHVKTAPEGTALYVTASEITDTPIGDRRENGGQSEWMKEFGKFKNAEKAKKAKAFSQPDKQSSILTGTSVMSGMRHKKRKGAMTDNSNYSMTSSSLLRTEGLTLLDARFDKIEEEYAEDGVMMYDDNEDDDGGASIMSASSKASSQALALPLRADFDNIMDDFLENYQIAGRKRVKRGKNQTGMEQLNEIRKELGPPKIPPKIRAL